MKKADTDRGYMVATSNEFMQAAHFDLTAEMQKFLCYVISKIKPTDAEFQKYTISALDFAKLAGIDKKNAYREFAEMIEAFDGQARWIKIGDDTIYFRVFSESEYNAHQGSVTLVLNSRLKKHLLQLGTQYTMFELWNILSLKKKHSIRLYELFRSHSYKQEIDFDIEQLKGLLCCEGYTDFRNFRQKVLDQAVKEINEYTDLSITYELIRGGKGGKVNGMQFHIKRKKALEAYEAYVKTVEKINKKNRQVPGQISLFEMSQEDFKKYSSAED